MRTQQTQSSGDSVSSDTRHVPVLLQEILDGLNIAPSDVVFDGTLGGAGHSSAFANLLDASGTLIASDVDSVAIARGKAALDGAAPRVIIVHRNFTEIDEICAEHGIAHINKALLDLGWSSDQILQDGRGLSFMKDEPLNMRLADTAGTDALTAETIVNEWAEDSIADILYGWGGERYSRKIAHAIATARESQPIETTGELVEIIKRATPVSYHHGRIHPATRSFQALRIAVNDEIGALKETLLKLRELLASGGRLAVISFHSVEDRVVKQAFKSWVQEGAGTTLSKKPIVPSEQEQEHNVRSRSAKLRIFEKL